MELDEAAAAEEVVVVDVNADLLVEVVAALEAEEAVRWRRRQRRRSCW